MAELVRICSLDDLEDDGMIKVEILGCDYLVVRRGDRIHVTDASCTHEWADLSEGTLEGDTVTCPQHGGQFDIRSGAVLRDPPSFPLDTYNVEVKDGEVYADVTGY